MKPDGLRSAVLWEDKLGGQWLVTIGFEWINDRLEPVSFTIAPSEVPRTLAGKAREVGDAQRVLTAEKLRAVRFGALKGEAQATLTDLRRRDERRSRGQDPTPSGPGRPRISQSRLVEAVRFYDEALRAREKSPVGVVAGRLGVSRSQAGRYLERAREEGLTGAGVSAQEVRNERRRK